MPSLRSVVLVVGLALASCTKPAISEPSASAGPSSTAPRFVQRPGRADDGKLEVTLLPWDSEALPALERIAKAHADASSAEPQVRFESDPELPVARLVEVMNAVAGSECTTADVLNMKGGDPKRCHFVLRIVEADPRDPPPVFKEPEVWGGLTG